MGSNNSVMEQDIETHVTQRMSSRLTSEVDASSNIFCNNEQSIVDSVINCDVKFGAQTCKASSMMSYVGSNSLEHTTKQEIIDITEQISDQEIKGIPLGSNNSYQRIKQKAVYDQRNEMVMALHTNCSINIDAYNVQTVKNSECKSRGSIKFAAQSITADAMAKCGSTQGGKAVATQGLTKMIKQSATQKIDGPTLLDLLLPFLIIPLMLFLVPLSIRKGFTAFKRDSPPPTLMQRISSTLLYMFVLYVMLWWPGVGSWYLGIWPYGEPVDPNETCKGGEVPKNYEWANSFTQWDPLCLLSNANPCTESDRFFHYQCGLMSGKCNSSETRYATDMKRYKNYIKACGDVPKNSIGVCDGPGVYSRTIGKKYSGCELCTTGSYTGGFVKKDVKCSDTQKASYTAFMLNPTGEKDETKKKAKDCLPGETGCFADNAIYKSNFPDDCEDPSYQAAKRRASKYTAKCEEINKYAALKNTEDLTHSLKEQCSSNAQSFLNCDSKGRCYYLAEGCKWNGTGTAPTKVNAANFKDFDCSDASEESLKACTNDFTDCTDGFYLEDSEADRYARDQCKKKYDSWSKTHVNGAIGSGIVLAILFLTIIILAFLGRRPHAPVSP